MMSDQQRELPFESEPPRRRFFRLASLAFGLGAAALGAVGGLWTAAVARFMTPNETDAPDLTFKAGFPGEYAIGKVETRFKDRYQTWIVALDQGGRKKIVALRAVCTHLGCATLWSEADSRFRCPCHGSGFSLDGNNLEGPAPRPLDRHAIRLTADGRLEIDCSKVFLINDNEAVESFVMV
jgi:cytochrome b6-f complex iron-sulfur subunit